MKDTVLVNQQKGDKVKTHTPWFQLEHSKHWHSSPINKRIIMQLDSKFIWMIESSPIINIAGDFVHDCFVYILVCEWIWMNLISFEHNEEKQIN